ncbi:MAG: cupin domain-containing protein [Clostridia bacterium]
MDQPKRPIALRASDVPPRKKSSNYPEPFFSRMAKREKRQLGDVFGLKSFGVNLTRLAPGGESALRHWHTKQDEFVYIVSGRPTLVTDAGDTELSPGMVAGFKGGEANGHHLVNRTREDVVYLEVGDRTPGDEGRYPDDDLTAAVVDGQWRFTRKDGTPY